MNDFQKQIEYWKAKYRKAHSEAKYWQEAYFKVKDENERLSLDLGLREQGFIK